MEARRCISYLTIELKGPIPRELRPLIGNRIYGCDICQEVCPWNAEKFVQITDEPAFHAREGLDGPALIELMGLSQEEFSARFRKSPVKRTKRRGLLRNVAVALGNWGSEEAVPVLVDALEDHEPLIRGHAAWALGRIGGEAMPSPRCGSGRRWRRMAGCGRRSRWHWAVDAEVVLAAALQPAGKLTFPRTLWLLACQAPPLRPDLDASPSPSPHCPRRSHPSSRRAIPPAAPDAPPDRAGRTGRWRSLPLASCGPCPGR
jgi:hypothetical protein